MASRMRRNRLDAFLRTAVAALAMGGSHCGRNGYRRRRRHRRLSDPAPDDHYNLHREQIMATARDVEPVNYARYMIDYNNHSADVQQATRDEMHWFYSQTPQQRRAYSEELVTNFADPLTVAWPNHAKLF